MLHNLVKTYIIISIIFSSLSVFSNSSQNNAEKFQKEQAMILFKSAVSSYEDRDYFRSKIYFNDFQSLFPIDKLNLKVMEYQAMIFHKTGFYEKEALKWLDLFYRSPNDIGERALYKAGVLYINMGLYKKSKKMYKLLLENNSKSVYINKLRQLIQAESIILKDNTLILK